MTNKGPSRLHFEASANLQRLIGRELVPNEEMAFVELVKNAYDSGAQHVKIIIQPPSEKDPGTIEVRDDGQGMSLDNLSRLFMVAGYSERPEQIEKAKRIPTGEKGIGRFAADKLGKTLTVLTKEEGAREAIRLEINWEAFRNKQKKFHDISAPYRTIKAPELSYKNSYTVLTISSLRNTWPNQKRASIRAALAELLDPFRKKTDFEIDLQIIGSSTMSGPIHQERPGEGDIEIDFRVLRDGTVKRQLGGLLYKNEDSSEIPSSDNATQLLKGLSGRFLYAVKRGTKAFARGLRPGVRIYRDGFRVEPFGSPTADWLGISEKRAKRAGHAHIVPSRLFGFVEISRKEHPGLIDTTSRQALIDEDAARQLVAFLKGQVDFLEELIRKEVTEPRWKERQAKQAAEFEQARLHTLGLFSTGLAHELRQPLQVIRSESSNIAKRIEALGIKDQDVNEAQQSIDRNIERIDKNIKLIAKLSKGDIKDVETFDLAEVLRSECQLILPMCKTKKIELDQHLPDNQFATTNETTIISVSYNLLKNAMEALEEMQSDRARRISIFLSKENKTHKLEIADNGPGIPDDIKPKLFKKFKTKKTGGWGIALAYCHSLVHARGGSITCTCHSRQNVGTTFTVKIPDEQR